MSRKVDARGTRPTSTLPSVLSVRAAFLMAVAGLGCGGSDAPTEPSATGTLAPAAPTSSGPSSAPAQATGAAPAAAVEPPSELPNLASFATGARVVRFTTNASSSETPWALLDEDPNTIWQDSENLAGRIEAVIELAAPAQVEQVGVLLGDHYWERAPVEVVLELGDAAEGPFRPLHTFTPTEVPTRLVASTPGAHGRYLRVHLTGRRESSAAIGPFLDDVLVHGRWDTQPELGVALAGIWHGGWALGGVEFREVEGRLQGCLDRDGNAVVDVSVDGRTVALRWKADDGSRSLGLLVPTGDGHLQGTLQSWNAEGEGGERTSMVVERQDGAGSICAARALPSPREVLEAELSANHRALLRGLLFDFGSHQLRPEASATLDDVAAILGRHDGWRARLEGHTDDVGADDANLTLSQRRVSSTLDALVQRGVQRERLEAQGMGETRPVAGNDTPLGRAENRRVEIIVDEGH